VGETLGVLRESGATKRHRVKFILATDGQTLEAESLVEGETLACAYGSFGDHFGFFLPLAGITTVKQIRENAFDVKATGRLNRLYVELLRDNPDWEGRQEDFNHFMARLIFCFFAEDTGIFHGEGLFTNTIAQMSAADSSNTHGVIGELFRAMATPWDRREMAGIKGWANGFPYVNGGLFGPDCPHPLAPSPKRGEGEQEIPAPPSLPGRGVGGEGLGDSPHPLAPSPKRGEGGQEDLAPLARSGRGAGGEGLGDCPHPLAPSPKRGEGEQEIPAPLSLPGRGVGGEGVPRFSRIARSYLLHVGSLDWKQINPDIFGSMIQAIADENERGALGMHYTSVPNILKVLNPLFLDDLREQLAAAGENGRKLLNLRKRLGKIRVFDPACGSGNFLVIAYKEMRGIEAEVNRRRGESERASEIPLTNFRGIEIRSFAAEIARLALIIAEYQCNVLYRGSHLALLEFLPLKRENWITCGNALRLDWLALCPPTGKGVQVQREDLDLWQETRDQAEIDFQNEGGETYICGNPPYVGDKKQSQEQKEDIQLIFESRTTRWKSLDYVAGWFMKAANYGTQTTSAIAFVSTNSICQGQQVPILWSLIFEKGHQISFAHTSFKWANLASYNAGVTVIIIGLTNQSKKEKFLYSINDKNEVELKISTNINPYLATGENIFVNSQQEPIASVSNMLLGNVAKDGGYLICTSQELRSLSDLEIEFVRPMFGGQEFIKGINRYCFWITENNFNRAIEIPQLRHRFEKVRNMRNQSSKKATAEWSSKPYRFVEVRSPEYTYAIIVPRVSSENRSFLPVGLLPPKSIVTEAFALYDAPLWNMAIIASRLHLVWIATVCGKLETRYRYSNTLGWNTFPVPTLTEQNKTDLTRSAEDILLAREQYFPATIAEMYDPNRMDTEFPLVRQAHQKNDEIIERIYIGRRFKNDTERLEKLFEMYTKMTSQQKPAKKPGKQKP
jgi:hypothetical protein